MLKKYLSKLLPLITFLLWTDTTSSAVVPGECDGTLIRIHISDVDNISAQFNLYYKVASKKQKLFYSPKADRLSIACIKDKQGRSLLLIEEFCSGSVCSDTGTYSVFDPQNKRMLIKFDLPSFKTPKNMVNLKAYSNNRLRLYEQKNHDEVTKLLGYKPPFLPDYNNTFCCNINPN